MLTNDTGVFHFIERLAAYCVFVDKQYAIRNNLSNSFETHPIDNDLGIPGKYDVITTNLFGFSQGIFRFGDKIIHRYKIS